MIPMRWDELIWLEKASVIFVILFLLAEVLLIMEAS